MNSLRKAIEAYRKNSSELLLQPFKCKHNGKTGYNAFDQNYLQRKDLIFELYTNYTAEDRSLIKWLLHEDQKAAEFDAPIYTTDLCAFMLYKHMQPEDVYDLFEAKSGGNTDRQVYIDIELVFGFGREQMKVYLQNAPKNKKMNKEILKTIAHYESNPNALFKSRNEYIQYFETRKITIIQNDLAGMEEQLKNL